jgi:CheY-like chemotaxis protein
VADEHATTALDARMALVCVDDPARQSAVASALTEIGYAPEVPSSADNALDRLRKHPYEVVVVDELFEGATPLDNAVLKGLGGMTMAVRRYMFVALLGKSVPTLDNATAFSRSVNAVFSYGDVDQLAPMLQRAIADNDAFYRVFRDVLKAAGKR